MNDSGFQESTDTFKVKFEGSNSIDAEVFTRIADNIIKLLKESAGAIYPNAVLRFGLRTTNEEGFTMVIDVAARTCKGLSGKNNITPASEIIEGFLSFLRIKSHLNGHKPKLIDRQ